MTTQADFFDALNASEPRCPPGLAAWNGSDVQVRFNVYRNNRAVSLAAALADGFPVVAQLVGPDFFAAMARAFIQAHPPQSPVLVAWGEGFADFISVFMATLPPASQLPYLADVARLERARVQAFHAADASPLAARDLAEALQQPEHLPRLRFRLHPSLLVCTSAFPTVSLWHAHQAPEGDVQLPDWAALPGEAALVLRTGEGLAADVAVVPVPMACARFVAALQAGLPLAEAATAAVDPSDPILDLPAALTVLIQHQAFVECAL